MGGSSIMMAKLNLALIFDRILKGDKPGDLPVQQPTKFNYSIKTKTSKPLGMEVEDAYVVGPVCPSRDTGVALIMAAPGRSRPSNLHRDPRLGHLSVNDS